MYAVANMYIYICDYIYIYTVIHTHREVLLLTHILLHDGFECLERSLFACDDGFLFLISCAPRMWMMKHAWFSLRML